MKKLSLFLSLFSSLNFALFAYPQRGFSAITFSHVEAFGVWGSVSPFDVEGSSHYNGFDNECKNMYGQFLESTALVLYNVDDKSGNITGTISYLGNLLSLNGGQWKLYPAPIGPNGVEAAIYSFTQTSISDLPDVFQIRQIDEVKIGVGKPMSKITNFTSHLILSLIFPMPKAPVETQCFLYGKLFI